MKLPGHLRPVDTNSDSCGNLPMVFANIADMAELKDPIVAITGLSPLMPNRDCCSGPVPQRIADLGLA
jgi:hypothetical protein